MAGQVGDIDPIAVMVGELLDGIAGLEEPWRGNFRRFVAAAVGRGDGKGESTDDDLQVWLKEDLDLLRLMRRMLDILGGRRAVRSTTDDPPPGVRRLGGAPPL